MAGETDVVIRFLGDSTSIENGVKKIEAMGGRMKKWALGVGAAIGGAFAVKEVVNFGKSAVAAADESYQSTQRLQAIFKSMGDTTGKAGSQAEEYASKLSMQIGVEDDVIMRGQALLATFSNVSGTVGRSSGIFDRATSAAADLAAAGFGSIESNAVRLGKALQDPIKGTTALTKAGVTFTQQQKDQIEKLVKSGNVLAAQKIIMGEVEHQVKGTAAATATNTDKMKTAFAEFEEGIGKAIMPILNVVLPGLVQGFTWAEPIITKAITKTEEILASVVAWIVKNWPQISAVISEVFNRIASIVGPVISGIADFITGTLAPALSTVWDAVLKAAPDVIDLFSSLGEVWQKAWTVIIKVAEKLTPILAVVTAKLVEFVGWMARNKDIVLAIAAPFLAYVGTMKVMAGVSKSVTAATKLWAAAQWLVNAAMTANPIGLIVAGIAAVIAIIVLLYTKCEWFRSMIDSLWQFVQAAWDKILGAVQNVYNWIKTNWPLLLAILTGPIGLAVLAIVKNWDTIRNGIQGIWNWIQSSWNKVLGWLTVPIDAAKTAIGTAFSAIQTAASNVWSWIQSAWSSITGWLTTPFSSAWDTISGVIDSIKNGVQSIIDKVRDAPGQIANAAKGMFDGIWEAFKAPINMLIRGWNSLKFTIPSIDIPFDGTIGGNTIGVPQIPELATGGYTKKEGFAWLHPAEVVTPLTGKNAFGGADIGGDKNYYITVNVPVGASPAEVGRATVNAIRAYESVAGTAWRATPTGRR